MKLPVLTLPTLSKMAVECWPAHTGFDASTYFSWQATGPYLCPNVKPMLSPQGAETPQQLLEALCAKGILQPGNYVLFISDDDLKKSIEYRLKNGRGIIHATPEELYKLNEEL